MVLTNPVQAFTQQDILDLLERILPQEWLAPIREIGPGFELLQGYAAIFARLSTAVERLGQDSIIDIASAGTRATGTVQLLRAGSATINTPIPGQSGSAAGIVAGAPAGQMRVESLTNMSAESVGRFLDLDGTQDADNNGTFEIAAFVDAATVDVVNAAAVVPDGNNGAILWEEVSRTVTVKAGTVVRASRSGKDYVTTQDVTFDPSDTGPFDVPVRAIATGYEYNVTGQRTAADGTVLEGEVDTVQVLVERPELADTTIQVQQITDITGGTDEALAALGRNRGIEQGVDENDAAYRERVRRLPDTISPDAVLRVVENLLRPIDALFEIIETFEITYQTAYDAPNTVIEGSFFDPNLFVYDDPDADAVPFRNRWMDENDRRGAFIVVVENIQPLRDTSMVYDDTVGSVAGLISSRTGGQRAVGAYDVPSDLGFGAVQGSYDGSDLPKRALYKGLHDTLQEIKPAGVSAAVEISGE